MDRKSIFTWHCVDMLRSSATPYITKDFGFYVSIWKELKFWNHFSITKFTSLLHNPQGVGYFMFHVVYGLCMNKYIFTATWLVRVWQWTFVACYSTYLSALFPIVTVQPIIYIPLIFQKVQNHKCRVFYLTY